MKRSQMEKTFGGPIIVGRARSSTKPVWFWWTRDQYLWCSFCSRTFPNGTYRLVDGEQRCPYADCDADVAQDASEWSAIMLEHPNYPAAPWLGIQYPLVATEPLVPGSRDIARPIRTLR